MRTFISRLLDVVLRRRRDDRLSEEVQAHLDLLTDEHIARGLPPADARLAARKSFGGVDQVKMRYREQRGLPLVDALTQDLRFAIRVLARDRGFAMTAILVLGVGLGVNNMFFTLVYAHKFRGVTIEDVDRVMFVATFDDRGANRLLSVPEFYDLQARATSFSGLAAYVNAVATVGDQGRAADRFNAAYVTANAFPLLGLSMSVLLAMVGLYAVTARRVTLKTREIGLRMALGARSAQFARMIITGLRGPLLAGLLLGTAGAMAWDGAYSSGIAGVYASAPPTLLKIACFIVALVVVSCFIPLRRATRMSPVAALRHE